MKKNSTKGYAILGILFVLVSIIAFVIPTEKTETFWIAYIFTSVAFVAQIVIWRTAFGKEETLKSKFLGFPVVYISMVYLIVQIIAFAIFLFVPMLPAWSAMIVCAVILGISAMCMIATDVGRSEVERIETKVQNKVFYIKNLQVDVEMLAERESDAEIKTALVQLAEKIRFSDPMSSELLEELEKDISDKVNELNNDTDKTAIIVKLNLLLDERNKKCKILK